MEREREIIKQNKIERDGSDERERGISKRESMWIDNHHFLPKMLKTFVRAFVRSLGKNLCRHIVKSYDGFAAAAAAVAVRDEIILN